MPPEPSPPEHLPTPPDFPGIQAPESADLTTWFLNAKRSLSSITLAQRAHVLVDSARAALQEASVISARCMFLRNALQDQLVIGGQLSRVMHRTRDTYRAEFEKTLTDLDTADIRLNETLERLRNSVVDPAFNAGEPPPSSPKTNGAEEQQQQRHPSLGDSQGYDEDDDDDDEEDPERSRPRTLHDFVEDEGIENLKSKLRHSIDYVQESHDALQSDLTTFDTDIQSLSSSLNSLTTPTVPSDTPLRPLEEHTEIIASLLGSLTQHYDRCSQALRAPDSPSTISLLPVLSRDASEVDDVVSEIRERLSAMEELYQGMATSLASLHTLDSQTTTLFLDFSSFTTATLDPCLATLQSFEAVQNDLKVDMSERLEELWSLSEFYESFLSAYDAMVIEVGRRKGVQARMEQVVKETLEKLQELYEEDRNERKAFRESCGLWLPVDIWPGLADMPGRWVIEKEKNGERDLPKLEKGVIEKAMRRRGGIGT